ncbi:hypothetical protein ACJX0J_032968 [Zea mays]
MRFLSHTRYFYLLIFNFYSKSILSTLIGKGNQFTLWIILLSFTKENKNWPLYMPNKFLNPPFRGIASETGAVCDQFKIQVAALITKATKVQKSKTKQKERGYEQIDQYNN